MRRYENSDVDTSGESDEYDDYDGSRSSSWRDRWSTRLGGWGTGLRGWGWMPLYQQNETRDTVPDDPSANEGVVTPQGGGGNRTLEGIATLLLVGGIILFLIPEPASSMLGIFLVLTGAILWLADALL